MRFFVHVMKDESFLVEDREGSPDLYSASGRAAELATAWIKKCSDDESGEKTREPLAIEVVDGGGKRVMRIPVNPAYR